MNDTDMRKLEERLKAIRAGASSELDGRVAASFAEAGRSARSMEDTEMTDYAEGWTKVYSLGHTMRMRRWIVGAAGTAVAAAMILMFSLYWGPGPEGNAYAALARAVENSKTAEWVHIRGEYMGEELEQWWSFKPFRRIIKQKDKITYFDKSESKRYVYDAAADTVTIDTYGEKAAYGPDGDEAETIENSASLMELMAMAIAEAEKQGAQVSKTHETIDGRSVDVFTIVQPGRGNAQKMAVDTATQRVVMGGLAANEDDPPSSWDSPAYFDYPEQGPADIYEAGAPRSAKVINGTLEEAQELRDKVEGARGAFAPTYHALIYQGMRAADGGLDPVAIIQVYKKNGRFRIEKYSIIGNGEGRSSKQLRREIAPEDATVLESWIEKGHLSEAYITDDQNPPLTTWVRFDKDGRAGTPVKMRTAYLADTVETLTWQAPLPLHDISTKARFIGAKEGESGRLFGVEVTAEPYAYSGQVVILPNKTLYYFDPEHNYAGGLYERISDMNAPWLADSKWLEGVELDEAARNRKIVETKKTVEYAQTPEGQWYARKVAETQEENGKAMRETETVVHLDTKREIPDDVFDTDNLDVKK